MSRSGRAEALRRSKQGPGWRTLAAAVLALFATLLPAGSQTPPAPHPVAGATRETVTEPHPGPARTAPVPPPTAKEAPSRSWGAAVVPQAPRQATRPTSTPGAAVATEARIEADVERTRFVLRLDRSVTPAVYTLASPYRVVIDLADVRLQLPPEPATAAGFIASWRHGLYAAGTSRIVLDASVPVEVLRSEVVAQRGRRGSLLVVELAATDPQSFVVNPPPEAAGDPRLRPAAFDDPPPAGADGKPVVVIDPGHGGVDPGAVAAGDLLEKNIVLSVAKALEAKLLAHGRYRVAMTRASDVFVALDERVRISKFRGASLFISIHADSVAEANLAQSVRGASIYTLSDRATDEQAQQLAEKENAADLVAGAASGSEPVQDEVRDILYDLMRRESAEFSVALRGMLAGHLRQSVLVAREPQRAGAFRVLRQPWCPAVLIELGYMSNASDQEQLRSEAWRRQVAGAIAAAVDQFFEAHPPAKP